MPTTAAFLSLLNRSVTLTRPTLASDGAGGSSRTLGANVTTRARLRPLVPSERESAAKMQVPFTHVLYVPGGVDVQRGDHFTVDGIDYRVIEVQQPSYAGHHLEVRSAREID